MLIETFLLSIKFNYTIFDRSKDIFKNYNGLEVQVIGKSPRPMRCGKKVNKGVLKKVIESNPVLHFQCLGKGKLRAKGLEGSKIIVKGKKSCISVKNGKSIWGITTEISNQSESLK
jgi:hypothetical protein